MPYSLKAIGFGAAAVIIVMIIGEYMLDLLQIEVSSLILGAIAGMVGAYVIMQIDDNKDKK